MIIFFEDGSITNESIYSITGEELIKVDAAHGFTANYNKLVAIEKDRDFDTRIYTNSLVALSNRWCWDEENKIPQLYLRNKDNEWENITHFTDKELRNTHNLEKIYVAGGFNIFNA